jgi:hypothetical protein
LWQKATPASFAAASMPAASSPLNLSSPSYKRSLTHCCRHAENSKYNEAVVKYRGGQQCQI